MKVREVVPQLRTTDLERSILFYTETPGFELAFGFRDFYAGIRAGGRIFLELDDAAAAAADLERKGVRLRRGVHETDRGSREFIAEDDQGHTLVFCENLS